ncbi:MAG: ABC transporter ATP-binding protein [Clostridiales bacterium]|nr:ABC transporter ATP-binding protein [Clostridiales bacterium]
MEEMKQGYLIKRFIPYFKKYKGLFVFDLLCASLTTVCELVLPIMVRTLTNAGAYDAGALTLELILKIGLLYIALRIMDAAAQFYMASTGHIMGAKIETDMRRDLFAKLQELPFSYYSNHKIGQLMSRITSDLFDVTEFAHHCPEEFFITGLKVIITFAVMCRMNIPLTIIIFAALPLMLVAVKLFNGKMRRQFKKQRVQIGEINADVEDTLLGIRVVKSFANEDIEKDKFERGNNKFLDVKAKGYYYMGGFQATTRIFDGLMYIVVVIAGAVFMMRGKILAGDLTAYLMYVTTLIASIRTIVQFTEQFQRGMTGIERFVEIMDEPVEIEDEPDACDIGEVEGNVRFENVDFSYADGNEKVLTNINLDIKKGGNVALVGPSGGGKTTLCNLIPRFYDVTAGRILIDGKDIKKATLHSLRSAIGMVQQDVFMFSGTVAENIAYGMPGASRDEIEQAAKKANAHEFIMKLPEGYDTYVGERGVKLSGGQKQRISIARVFLKNPPILILDEATSALDNESERIVQKSLEGLAKGRTVFTIAHRLTTIKNADIILVLTQNGIEEQGTHRELMEKNGIYAGLYGMYASM